MLHGSTHTLSSQKQEALFKDNISKIVLSLLSSTDVSDFSLRANVLYKCGGALTLHDSVLIQIILQEHFWANADLAF